jgi:hypothetical protein
VLLKHAMVDIEVANGCPTPRPKLTWLNLFGQRTKILGKKVHFDLKISFKKFSAC